MITLDDIQKIIDSDPELKKAQDEFYQMILDSYKQSFDSGEFNEFKYNRLIKHLTSYQVAKLMGVNYQFIHILERIKDTSKIPIGIRNKFYEVLESIEK